jgi:hypothetical protein
MPDVVLYKKFLKMVKARSRVTQSGIGSNFYIKQKGALEYSSHSFLRIL